MWMNETEIPNSHVYCPMTPFKISCCINTYYVFVYVCGVQSNILVDTYVICSQLREVDMSIPLCVFFFILEIFICVSSFKNRINCSQELFYWVIEHLKLFLLSNCTSVSKWFLTRPLRLPSGERIIFSSNNVEKMGCPGKWMKLSFHPRA